MEPQAYRQLRFRELLPVRRSRIRSESWGDDPAPICGLRLVSAAQGDSVCGKSPAVGKFFILGIILGLVLGAAALGAWAHRDQIRARVVFLGHH